MSESIYKTLPPSERKRINKYDLSQVAQAFVYSDPENGKQKLISILKDQFLTKHPTSLEYHEKLARVFHIKEFVTTNYDSLIELALGDDGQVIMEDEDLASLKTGKRYVYKIHGDLSREERIVITKDDYVNMLAFKSDSLLSVALTERLITKSHIFLGYNLDDINVNVLLAKIQERVGEKRKPWYFVAPKIQKSKLNLLKNKGIKYIKASAEEFIERLHKDCYENLIPDMTEGKVSPETIRKSFNANKLVATIKGDQNGYRLAGIQGVDGKVTGSLSIHFSDKGIANDFYDFIQGKSIKDLTIPSNKLNGLQFKSGDIPLLGKLKGDYELKLISVPNSIGQVNVRFMDSKYEVRHLGYKAFSGAEGLTIVIDFACGTFSGKIQLDQEHHGFRFNFHAEHSNSFGRISEELEYFNFMYNFSSGQEFQIEFKNGYKFKRKLDEYSNMKKESKFFVDFFTKMRMVEDHFGVSFDNISRIDQDAEQILDRVCKVIKGKSYELKYTDTFEISLFDEVNSDTILALTDDTRLNNPNSPLMAITNKREIVDFYGQQLDLGYCKIVFQSVEVVNKNDVLAGITKRVLLRSRTKKAIITYMDSHPMTEDNAA